MFRALYPEEIAFLEGVKARMSKHLDGHADRIRDLEARLAATEAQRDAAVEALKPFAKAGELFGPGTGGEHSNISIYAPVAGSEYSISADDLRRAAALHSASETND